MRWRRGRRSTGGTVWVEGKTSGRCVAAKGMCRSVGKSFRRPCDIEQQCESSNWAKGIGNEHILDVVARLQGEAQSE